MPTFSQILAFSIFQVFPTDCLAHDYYHNDIFGLIICPQPNPIDKTINRYFIITSTISSYLSV